MTSDPDGIGLTQITMNSVYQPYPDLSMNNIKA